jgi:hypothetical protein
LPAGDAAVIEYTQWVAVLLLSPPPPPPLPLLLLRNERLLFADVPTTKSPLD